MVAILSYISGVKMIFPYLSKCGRHRPSCGAETHRKDWRGEILLAVLLAVSF